VFPPYHVLYGVENTQELDELVEGGEDPELSSAVQLVGGGYGG
jgi:hypothetical protein